MSQYRNQKFGIDVFSGRIDLEKEFRNKMKLELGGLYLQADADTNFQVENINPPSEDNSIYNFKEKNVAAYTQFSGNHKKLNYIVGLRAENTINKGKYASESSLSIDKNYINFFPKAQLEMAIDSSNTISMNYAKSITRPNFSSTSQVSVYINPYFVWANNINLNPTLSDEISLNCQYKDKSLRMVYYKTVNPVYYSASFDNSQNLLTFTSTNFEKESGYAMELTLPFKYKLWKNTNVINVGKTKVEDQQAEVQESKPSLYVYSNHIFSLPKKVELSFTAWGYTPQKLGIFQKSGLVTMDDAVSKTFFEQLDCTISVSDIFRKMNFKDDFTINNVSAKGKYYTDSHAVSFSVKYSFGKIKKSEFVEKSIDENSGRIR